MSGGQKGHLTSLNQMKKLILILIPVLILGVWKFSQSSNQPRIAPNPQQDLSSIGMVQGQSTQNRVPTKLTIAKIGVEASVEQVGLDKEGKMDVPKKSEDVGWYLLGSRPGEKGNTVMAGHFDKVNGSPAVFWNLNKLETGDKVQVTDDQNGIFIYKVVDKKTYADKDFPLQEVFGPTDRYRLNLITCQGTWDGKNYSNREVVYSELVK
jgi:LPXTG-site transpeptidase (sortase) family protein